MTVSSPECYLPCGCVIHDDGTMAGQCDVLTLMIHEVHETRKSVDFDLDEIVASLIFMHTHKTEEAGVDSDGS